MQCMTEQATQQVSAGEADVAPHDGQAWRDGLGNTQSGPEFIREGRQNADDKPGRQTDSNAAKIGAEAFPVGEEGKKSPLITCF
jgi:hypothetical protein